MLLRASFLALLLWLPQSSLHAEHVGPWDLDELKNQVPAMHWVSEEGAVHSLLYAGENYQGHPTEVFAFYASPITLGEAKPGTKFPGVVLIHGGGGTAFAKWAWLWAKRGYAAIAMDLGGMRPPDPQYDPKTGEPLLNERAEQPLRVRLPDGGPEQGGKEKFNSILGPVENQWPFHAAASALRAHSLLRSFPEVDAAHTAVTGISWGGYTTCLVASLDDRFQAAVPVYGCGFLFEGESVQKPSIDSLAGHKADWIRQCDPSSYLPRCHVPILFVNGSNDVHYPLDSYEKSFDCVPGEKEMRIQINMPHGHGSGWAPQEIGLFIDAHCRGGQPLPVAGKPEIVGEEVHVPVKSQGPIKSAELHFTTDGGLRSKRKWQSLPATVQAGVITAPKPPAEANTWFVSVTDDRGAKVTSPVQFAPETAASAIAENAQGFLATLDDANRNKVIFDFKDEAQRKRWSNLPTSFSQRAGLRMGDLTQPQRDAALAVLATALSPQGYTKAMEIVEGDEEVKKSTGQPIFGHDNYYISFLGQPSATEPWMIQFGGHHLGINITLAGDRNMIAPSHTGAQPSHYEVEGKLVRPLGGESDKAFALLSSLDEAECKQAILGSQMHDLVLGPGRDGQTIQPEGIKGSALTDSQREALLDLASEWIGIMRESAAKAKMAEIRKDIADTWFAWSGPTEKGGAAYFRIQGPTVFIEYAPQKLGGDPTNHIHTIYRDPTNDYGVKWAKP